MPLLIAFLQPIQTNNLQSKDVFIIDSFAIDKTIDIAKKYPNVTILQNKWVNRATQFNWALEQAPIKTEWVLRLEADEYLTDELKKEIQQKLPTLDKTYIGIIFPLRRVFRSCRYATN